MTRNKELSRILHHEYFFAQENAVCAKKYHEIVNVAKLLFLQP